MSELPRQLVHVSGIFFLMLAIFVNKNLVAIYFLMISAFFLFYSILFRRQRKGLRRLTEKLEKGFRHLVRNFEREETRTPFIGAFWLYFAFGITLLLFPLMIAIVSCFIVAVSDSLSTMIGKMYGKHRIIENKTLEGIMVFFLSAFIIAFLFLGSWIAIMTALVASFAELIPVMWPFRKLKERELIDDNYTVPIITAIFLFILSIWFNMIPYVA